jgi:hypothetical protein
MALVIASAGDLVLAASVYGQTLVTLANSSIRPITSLSPVSPIEVFSNRFSTLTLNELPPPLTLPKPVNVIQKVAHPPL